MSIAKENYEPARSSVRTERGRIVNKLASLEQEHADAVRHAETEFDSRWQRLALRLRNQLTAEREKLAQFDQRHQKIETAEKSDEALRAWQRANKAAIAFEKKLTALSNAAKILKEAGADVADTIRSRDMGIWPSRRLVDEAVRGRVIDVLGDIAEVRLPGYGSYGRRTARLDERFSRGKK